MPAVELRGNADLRKALKRFTPDLEKALKSELRRGLMPVVTKAKGFVDANSPLRGWARTAKSQGTFPTYSAFEIRGGIGYTIGVSKVGPNGFSSMARIFNKTPAGAIWERARAPQEWVGPQAAGTSKGVSRSNWKGAGAQFVKMLPPVAKSSRGTGRGIFKAWAQDQGKAVGIANKAIDTATRSFNDTAKRTLSVAA